jgi:hypothetical protein
MEDEVMIGKECHQFERIFKIEIVEETADRCKSFLLLANLSS